MAITILTAGVSGEPDRRKRIGFYYPDINRVENVEFKNKITQHPIENGENVADHIYKEPLVLMIEGVTSDVSNDIVQGANGPTTESGRALLAYQTLEQLAATKEPFEVLTGYAVYPRMLIAELNLPRTITQGTSLYFSARLEQVTLVDTEKTTITRPKRASTEAVRRKVSSRSKRGKVQPGTVSANQSSNAFRKRAFQLSIPNIANASTALPGG
jgi:hypothetical protein